MTAFTAWPKAAIQETELTMLRHLLVEWCHDHAVSVASPLANSAARSLIEWFEFGVTSVEELRRVIRAPL